MPILSEEKKEVIWSDDGRYSSLQIRDDACVWSAVNIDLFGPIVKKGARIFKKVYRVIYACTRTRSVYLDVATDYSMESVLHTVRRLLACKGEGQLIISDPGSKLRGAQRELSEWT